MEESWRMMRMGSTATRTDQSKNQPKNQSKSLDRSPEDTIQQNGVRGYDDLSPEDFNDVFGGPPRSVLFRQYSVEGKFARSTSMVFEDMFKKPNGFVDLGGRSDRRLPEFRIPESRAGGRESEEEFYSDIFGNSRRSRSRSISQANSQSKSKSTSSSILSSEEFGPFRPAVVDDGDVSVASFAAKLRPLNISSKWKMHEEQQMANSPCSYDSYEIDNIHKFKGCYSGLSQRVSSPEVTTFRPNSYTSVKESTENLQVNSPASIVSSLNQDQGDETSTIHEEEDDDDDDDDEIMSSYVIEISPRKTTEKNGESHAVDEAIAWAKQKCEARDLEDVAGVNKIPDVQIDGTHGSREPPSLEKQKVWTAEEPLQEQEKDGSPSKQMELELLDEDVNLWSEGKEQNIRLLLSTLHHILWPSSGWIMIPLPDLNDSSNVKKAYQKARLCLHPDKLQQRGVTTSQKYVAEKAFPILQDAWATFISQDVCSSIK